jgi:Kef-type K+ transport system membrane component KefB
MQTFPILVDLGLVVSAATVLLLLGRALGLPQILSYMVAGLLLGPATGVLEPEQSVALLSELGVALLLFLVGLELSVARVRDVGGAALSAGLAQVAITALLGAALAAPLGFARADALVLGLALTFSSTVVVVKLLDRIGGVGSVAGRTAIGILLVQDVVVAVALTAVGGLEGEGTGLGSVLAGLARAAGGMLGLALVAVAGVRWLLPRLFAWIAPSSETLLVVGLTWCFGFIVGAEALEVSIELGAFIAGLALAQLPYAGALERRVHPLADFFLAVFFVALGAGMDPSVALDLWPQALALSGFVLLIKPALVTGLLLRRRYDARTAFVTGLTLGQVSEFGFLLVAVALASGVAGSPDLAPLLGLVGLVTIGISSLVVPHGPALYRRLAGVLPEDDGAEAPPPSPLQGHVVVVGMNTLGRTLVHRLAARGETVVAIDTDPSKLEALPARTVFGNADSAAVLRRAGVDRARLVIAAPQIEDVNALIAYRCNRVGVPVSVHAFDPTLGDELLEIGADHLMMPKLDGIRLVERELHHLGVLG